MELVKMTKPICFFLMAIFMAFRTYGINQPNIHTNTTLLSLNNIDSNSLKYEYDRINHAFSVMDELLAKAFVKIEKPDHEECYQSSLLEFLTGPNDINEIFSRLKGNTNKKIREIDSTKLNNNSIHSFVDAARELVKLKIIDEDEAHELILENSPLRPKDFIKLIQNGIVHAKNGSVIKLRTGARYGDIFSFEDDIYLALKKIPEEYGIELPDLPLMELLDGPLRPIILKALNNAGMRDEEIISDANVIHHMKKYLLLISSVARINWLKPNLIAPGVSINPVTTSNMVYSTGISAVLMANFLTGNQAALTHSFSLNPFGLSYSGSWSMDRQNLSWWLFYQDGYFGLGGDIATSLDKNSLWSSSNASWIDVGLFAGGWKNYILAGISVQTLLASTIGMGASASLSVSCSHDVAYLGKKPLDYKIAAVRGLHQIEINDKKGIGGNITAGINFSSLGIPLAWAFKAGGELTRKRIFRTHTDLGLAQDMLDEGKLPGLLHLVTKKIDKTRTPKFDDPDLLKDGDELVEVKTGKLFGTFIIGIQTAVPIYAARVGANLEMTAEFELGLRRLPNNKFEVSIEPRCIHEMSIFASLLDVFGTGLVQGIAVARKQIFLFDFNEIEGKKAYFELITNGILPSIGEIEAHTENHGPEHLLAEFRAQNNAMRKHGVTRTYLEKVKIKTNKAFAGINGPVIPSVLKLITKARNKTKRSTNKLNLNFEGIDREFLHSQSKCVATNGLIAISRRTAGWKDGKGQGFSGRYNQDLYVTHRTLHSIEKLPSGLNDNKWQFDSLVINAQISDTVITDDEENKMVNFLNRLFKTHIGTFKYQNSKSSRSIMLERELKRKDLAQLASPETKKNIPITSQVTGVSEYILYSFLEDLKDKHVDQQAKMVKTFVQSSADYKGFAAIHHLLGANVQDLRVLAESSYGDTIDQARKFLISFSSRLADENTLKADFTTSGNRENKKKVQKFYKHARIILNDIDKQLRFLSDDQYLIDDNSLIHKIYGKNKVDALIRKGVRQNKNGYKSGLISTREQIYKLMDLKAQGFSENDRLLIYSYAKKKDLRFQERSLILKAEALSSKAIKRDKIWEMIEKMDERIQFLEKDEIMAFMDKEYIQTQTEILKRLKKELYDLTVVN